MFNHQVVQESQKALIFSQFIKKNVLGCKSGNSIHMCWMVSQWVWKAIHYMGQFYESRDIKKFVFGCL